MANETLLNGYTIQIDNSGVGHNWRTVDQDDLPPDVAEEIAAEIDGGNESHGDYVATNGLHYRWFPVADDSAAGDEPVKHGNVWYTEDAEYGVRDTHSGAAVYRGDGSYAEFASRESAEEAAEKLANGEADDSDYEWIDR